MYLQVKFILIWNSNFATYECHIDIQVQKVRQIYIGSIRGTKQQKSQFLFFQKFISHISFHFFYPIFLLSTSFESQSQGQEQKLFPLKDLQA